MITILILNKSDDVKVLRYMTDEPREAARLFSEDWLNGKIKFGTETVNDRQIGQADHRPVLPPSFTEFEKPRLAYTIKETAELIGVSYATVYRLLQRGLLRCSQALRIKIIPRKEIERFLKETAEA